MWNAQQSSLLTSSSCNVRLDHYAAPEVTFSHSWISSADYVAAVHFHSNVKKSELFMSSLPSRVLQEGDSPPNIADLSAEENHALSIFKHMNFLNKIMGKDDVT
ncbi:hypothetical protein AAFF_G00178800 [Aldrovandia affinis]|uniref:Uncharacterized protein n=1 Tax=Aldrovandia affinis TaxID=143900 RepID=A0AAD7W780_9TELE|nr:hypothetical protein AAFF_G00178800 [Aldrovandia affinis]